ncbi:hypothetical protein [Emcibacter sp. SYSU 3D8]|uniref:hypothetical protein n=1 Tax=Emcibacter sp. SYSU 3D8 TaxID=3133969 RepID=UPI0031FEE686
MHRNAGKFSIIAVAVLAAAMAINLGAAKLALKMPTKRSIGMCSMIDQRIALAQAAPSPKMLIVGGSGTTQGIKAKTISEMLGIRAQNFGLHGSFGPGFDLFLAKKALRPGDSVLLTFEYSAYLLDKPTDVSLDVMYGCGHDYLKQYSMVEQIRIMVGFPLSALLDRITFALAPAKPTSLPEYSAWGDQPKGHFPETGEAHARRVALYRPMQVVILADGAAAQEIADFAKWARQNQIELISTWPNTLAFKEYLTMPGFAEIRRFYEHLGIPVIGAPQLAMLPVEYMSDTQYHLNDEGIRIRTARLAKALAARPELLAPLRGE